VGVFLKQQSPEFAGPNYCHLIDQHRHSGRSEAQTRNPYPFEILIDSRLRGNDDPNETD
jgi:hypothetical protein